MNRYLGLACLILACASSVARADTVVVTGANRGLGLACAQKYAERGWTVVATARKPGEAAELRALQKAHPALRIEALDATDPASIGAFAKRLGALPVDVLVNNAGTIGEESEQALGKLDAAKFDGYMRVNALSALLVTEALLPNLRAGKQKKVVGISARVASFAAYPRIHSGLYFYKASKTALNMILRNLAMDLQPEGIAVIALSPGVVNTYGTPMDHDAMSPEMRRSMTDIDTSVSGMMRVIDGLTLEKAGAWYRFDGTRIDW